MKAIFAASAVLIMLLAGCTGGECPDLDDPVCGSDGVTYDNACLAQKAGVQVESLGACAGSCSDSDGGKDIFTEGEVLTPSAVSEDKCLSSLIVEEGYCTSEGAETESLPCPQGYECQGGKCAEVSCQDTDGGMKEDTKGTTTSGLVSEGDECIDGDSVKEYYCANGQITSKNIDCATGDVCVAGACVEEECKDSDGGKDKSKAGTASKGDVDSADTCADALSVTEYYCSDGQIRSEKMPCGSGYSCVAGKCEISKCSDSDGGKDQFKKGTTSYQPDTVTDNCYNSANVIEYFCKSDTEVATEKISCGTGYECLDGACKVLSCTKDEEDIDDTNVRYEIAEYDDADELTLFVSNIVEINDEMFLKLYSVGTNTSTFRLYLDHEALLDGDHECAVTISEGDTENDLCGENTGDVTVNTVDGTDDFVEVTLEEYYATQYWTEEGSVVDWTGASGCPEDGRKVTEHVSFFYPYLDTSTSGLDLEGKTFMLLGEEVDISAVDPDAFSFDIGSDDFELEDGDVFDFEDVDYTMDLSFNDGGLFKIIVEPD